MAIKKIEDSIKDSKRKFIEHAWPRWKSDLNASEILPVEGNCDKLSKAFDAFGTGSFFIHSTSRAPIRISSRVVRSTERQFTIRYQIFNSKTSEMINAGEYFKKCAALDDIDARRYLSKWTFQSCVKEIDSSEDLLYTSKVDTIELISFARDNIDNIKIVTPPGNSYLRISHAQLLEAGIDVCTHLR